jgi:hypothetical protein
MSIRHSFALATFGIAALAAPLAAAEPSPEDIEFFESKIRPVLVESCSKCHSAGPKAPKGGLAIDNREALLKGGDTGPAIVPGKPDDSLLIKALRYGDLQMPPKGKLPDAVIADFVRWVERGAADPRTGTVVKPSIDFAKAREFWSFRPVQRPALPDVKLAGWGHNGVDRFILARLEQEKLHPVRPADKRTLLRRASFDLTGLPPTPAEVEAFMADESPEAFAHVVDRLLASPAYGERWARYWLDVARYAEDQAHTFGVEPNVQAWRYRDWVIDALNADMPYDRFVKLQIAADLIDAPEEQKRRDLPALGFFGLGAQYYKNTDAAKATADELDDRVDTLCRGFLGLTVSCARCHDHKFDPIPTQDYYSLAGVFHSSKLTKVALAPADVVARYEQAQGEIRKEEERYKKLLQEEKVRVAEGMTPQIGQYLTAAWVLRARRAEKPGYSTNDLAKEQKLNTDTLNRWVKFIESNNVQGCAPLDAYRKLPVPVKGNVDVPAEVTAAATAFQQEVESYIAIRDGKAPEPAKDAEPAKEGDKPAEKTPPPAPVKLTKAQTDLLRVVFTGDQALFPVADDTLKARLPAERMKELDTVKSAVEALKKTAPPMYPVAHGLAENGSTDLKVYVRGNPAKQGDLAPRRFLRIVAGDEPAAFKKGSGRLELAEAIANKDNPLTARVMVNRIWQHHFGKGIVITPSNFGQLGERPTHPELLDYLTADFIDSGWSIKALHREIMLSATYQMSTEADKENAAIDVDNRNLWRMNRHRLDIEAYRDALLAVAGQLDPKAGGPTVDLRPSENHRRTVYAKISRHDLDGTLRLFDFPDANITSEKRTETTVPQQQLYVLNSPFVAERARGLAARVRAGDGDDASKVRQAIFLAYARPATDAEVALALKFLQGTDPTEENGRNQLDRWQRYAQILLASNEFITVD